MPNILSQPIYFIISLFILFFSIILHEVAHGWTAEKLGDPTARLAGRITLNPIPHIDLLGTIILPLMLILLGSNFLIGWAKPVPVNFYRLRHQRRDTILVSLSGIVTNLSLAVLASLLWRLFHVFNVGGILLYQILYFTVSLNLLLAFFNLIPLPPLDGSKVLGALFPSALGRMIYDPQVNLLGTFVLFALLGTGVLWRILDPLLSFFLNLFLF
ncbi:MAG: site-2 protease family protein [Caldiserica bacterium]|jgi:Zn-dependent protease|nr:site-2 protease family protein [Caldisericota bacterium]